MVCASKLRTTHKTRNVARTGAEDLNNPRRVRLANGGRDEKYAAGKVYAQLVLDVSPPMQNRSRTFDPGGDTKTVRFAQATKNPPPGGHATLPPRFSTQ
jgi:hypothetical protein